MNKFIMTTAAACLALGSAAHATTMTAGDASAFDDGWATWIEYDSDAARGDLNNRDEPLNALGETDGNFFEIGYGSSVILQFGTLFKSPGTAVEVTFGDNFTGWPESVDVYVGTYGAGGTSVFGSAVATLTNDGAQGSGVQFTFAGGPFDALKLVDKTDPTKFTSLTGGWDIDAVRISPVPLPAGGLLLLTGFGALALRRRRKAA